MVKVECHCRRGGGGQMSCGRMRVLLAVAIATATGIGDARAQCNFIAANCLNNDNRPYRSSVHPGHRSRTTRIPDGLVWAPS